MADAAEEQRLRDCWEQEERDGEEEDEADEAEDESSEDDEPAEAKRRKRDNRAHFGNNPRFYLLHYMQLKGGFLMVDGDAVDEWPANLKRSGAAVERFQGRYVVVPKRNSKAGRASLRARFCPDLRAIGFVAPGEEASPSCFYFSRPKVDAEGVPRPLDLYTLQERAAAPSAKRRGSFLQGLAQKRQAAAGAPAAPAAAEA